MDLSLYYSNAYMEGLHGLEMTELPADATTDQCEELLKSYNEGIQESETNKLESLEESAY